ncbi:unnamed protein product [Prunus armeniaca]
MASSIEVGGSWSTNEDIALCQSWVNISHDPITGNEMKFHHMWSKIHGEFCQRSGSIRTEMALSSRWKLLNKELGKWRNALTKAKANIQSGQNLTDEPLLALALDFALVGGDALRVFKKFVTTGWYLFLLSVPNLLAWD